jgi:Protein of unknown function (DUF2568).
MSVAHPLNLTVAFLLELAVVAAVGFWGFTLSTTLLLRIVVGIGVSVLMAVLWGLFAAPRANVPLTGAAGVAFQIGWFGVGALSLAVAGRTTLAVGLAGVYLVNSALLRLSRQ